MSITELLMSECSGVTMSISDLTEFLSKYKKAEVPANTVQSKDVYFPEIGSIIIELTHIDLETLDKPHSVL